MLYQPQHIKINDVKFEIGLNSYYVDMELVKILREYEVAHPGGPSVLFTIGAKSYLLYVDPLLIESIINDYIASEMFGDAGDVADCGYSC